MKAPLKGNPNFYHLNNSQLNEGFNLVEQLLCSYKEDGEVSKTLNKIWNDLREERSSRESYIVPHKVESAEEPVLKIHKLVKNPLRKVSKK